MVQYKLLPYGGNKHASGISTSPNRIWVLKGDPDIGYIPDVFLH